MTHLKSFGQHERDLQFTHENYFQNKNIYNLYSFTYRCRVSNRMLSLAWRPGENNQSPILASVNPNRTKIQSPAHLVTLKATDFRRNYVNAT